MAEATSEETSNASGERKKRPWVPWALAIGAVWFANYVIKDNPTLSFLICSPALLFFYVKYRAARHRELSRPIYDEEGQIIAEGELAYEIRNAHERIEKLDREAERLNRKAERIKKREARKEAKRTTKAARSAETIMIMQAWCDARSMSAYSAPAEPKAAVKQSGGGLEPIEDRHAAYRERHRREQEAYWHNQRAQESARAGYAWDASYHGYAAQNAQNAANNIKYK